MSAAPQRNIAAEICRAFGLDPSSVVSLDLRLRPDELPRATVVYAVPLCSGEGFDRVSREFDLVPAAPRAEPASQQQKGG